ncbi:MAG: NAD(P)-dependent oxidoreductase [Bacteroidales bacterium]
MNILIIDTVHEILIKKLRDTGFSVDYIPHIDENEIENIIHQYSGLILRSKLKIGPKLIDKGSRLKFIARVGAGMENIDIKYAKTQGIICFNSPEGNRDAVGEQAVGMLLSIMNNICKANSEVKKGIWDREGNRGVELKNRTVGIIGYGNMGSAFAEKLSGLGCNIISYDKYKFNFSNHFTKEVTLQQLFDETDILSIHVPLTPETHYMVNHKFINSFRKPIYIVNTARGKIINTKDLTKNLKNGKVLGAALDVLEIEKSTFEEINNKEEFPSYYKELTSLDNVILTPHVAGWTEESNRKLSEIIANKIIAHYI